MSGSSFILRTAGVFAANGASFCAEIFYRVADGRDVPIDMSTVLEEAGGSESWRVKPFCERSEGWRELYLSIRSKVFSFWVGEAVFLVDALIV
jgi:hypothetical protein